MKKKNHLKNLLTIIGLISLITASTITYATHTVGDYELACKESIQYYMISPTEDELLEEGDELTVIDCPTNADGESTDHGEFPSAYTGDFDIAVSDKSKHESITRHTHSYTNTSEEECFDDEDIKIACPEDGSNHTGFNTIKYKATWIKKVELTLHEDLMENVDTSELDCEITNSDTTDETTCTGEGTLGFNNNEPPQEMGYYISFTSNADGTGTILLEFAENDAEGWVMPILFGDNPHLDHLNGFDLSDPAERTYDFGLSFETEEAEELFWSATTTSRIYLFDAVATMDPDTEPTSDDWEYQTTEGEHESDYYYWFDIGTATTIWEKEPEEEALCSELNIVPTNLEANEAGEITITVKDTDGANLPGNTIINVVNTAGGTLTNKNGAEVINTTKISKFPLNYSGGENGTIIFTIDSASKYFKESCADLIHVKEEQTLCKELNILPTNLEANEAGEITITVKDTDGANLPGNTIIDVINTAGGTLTDDSDDTVINTTNISKFPLNYSGGEDGTIIFKINSASEYFKKSCIDSVQVGEAVCSELLVDHYDPVYEDVVSTFAAQAKDGIFFMDDKIDYSVIPPVAPGDDVEYGYFYTSKPANSELTQDVSNAEYIKEIILDFYWSSLSLILDYYPILELDLGASLNKNLLLGLATGFDMTGGGTFKVDESLKAPSKEDFLMTETDLLKVDPGIFKVDPGIFEEDPDLISVIEIPEVTKWFLLANQVEADPVETVYFLGEKPGEQVIEIQPVDNSEAICLRKFDVEPLCKELQVNHEDPIYENRLTYFEASGLTWKDDDFSGRITYSVDSGHGTFYTYKPAGKTLNSTMEDVQQIEEFDASAIDISYYDDLREDPEKPTFGKDKSAIFKKGVPDFLNQVYFKDNNFKFEDAIMSESELKTVPKTDSSIIKILDDYEIMKIPDYKNPKIDLISPITKVPNSKSLQASLITLIPDPIILDDDLILDPGFGSGGESGNMITVDPGQKVWFYAEKEGTEVIHVSANCANSDTCVEHFDIIGFPVCGELTLNKANFEANESGEISIDSLEDINGNPINETIEINVTKTATGELTDKNNVVINDGDTITTDQFPLNYSGGESGEITFTIDNTSEYYSASCTDSIAIGVSQTCESLALTITEHNGASVTKLTNNKVYFVNANASFSSEASAEDQEVTLTMNSSFGAFIEAADLGNAATAASNMADNEELNDSTINNAPGLTTTNTITLTGDNTDQVLLVTYNNSADMASALSAYVTNFQEDCSQTVEYDGVEEPPTEETKCTDLTIKKPDSPWDKTYSPIINYEIFEIEVETDQAEKEDEIEITWEVTNGDAEWHKLIGDSEGKSKDTTNGKYSYYLKNISEGTKIEIYATDFKEECSDSIEYKKLENPEAPEFQKLVYKKNSPSDAKSILNLSSADASSSTIAFFVEFKPGTGTEIVEIRDKKIDSYEELTTPANIDIKIDDTTDYEENECEDKDKICVENKDNFKNGNPITFYNIGEAEKITITYEMSLAVELDCDNIEPKDGCGKIFENKAEYVAKDNEGNKLYEGSDSAKVIVICPYILTRSGSDAFFYDLPSTGVDVARCSEVKGCVGVCITPDPVKPEPGTPKTGSGEIIEDEIQLSLPTHDICTFSNDPKNIQGYNDVLENFSSTICEVQTAVAEEWQETHINSAIKANIERIARWGENLSGKNTHQAKPTSANGVFVKDGDKDGQKTYTIGTSTNSTIIEGDSNTPAAQTYIIQNADLIINNNIVYGTTDFKDPNKIPSVAFIVIDGNIKIAENVSELHGIYMAIDTNNEANDGQIISSGGRSTTKLTIYGNLFGNVNELFKNRIGIGDPLKDEGSVTIRYDERIILNTPPGISELIDIQQAIVPN